MSFCPGARVVRHVHASLTPGKVLAVCCMDASRRGWHLPMFVSDKTRPQRETGSSQRTPSGTHRRRTVMLQEPHRLVGRRPCRRRIHRTRLHRHPPIQSDPARQGAGSAVDNECLQDGAHQVSFVRTRHRALCVSGSVVGFEGMIPVNGEWKALLCVGKTWRRPVKVQIVVKGGSDRFVTKSGPSVMTLGRGICVSSRSLPSRCAARRPTSRRCLSSRSGVPCCGGTSPTNPTIQRADSNTP